MDKPDPRRWIPNLAGKVDPVVDQAFRYVFQALYDLRDGKVTTQDAGKTLQKVGGDLMGTVDNALLINKGPGAGTYTVGAKLTGGGQNGTITLDNNGRVTAIQQAT